MGLLDFLSGPFKGLVEGISSAIDDNVTNEEERLQLKAALQRQQQEAMQGLFEARSKIVEEQSKTVRAEIASDHWLAANWRPVLMLTFGFVILYSVVASTIPEVPQVSLGGLPERFWTLVTVGVGGYIGGRSAEKIIPNSKWGAQSARSTEETAKEVLDHISDAGSG